MSPELTQLVTLQAIDLELAHHRASLAALPRRIATAETALKQAETSLAATKASLAKEEILRRSHESDIATHKGKIGRLRKQMETATSAAQISALEHEITFAESAISTLEDQELASMERTETLDAESTRLTALVDSTTIALAETRVAASSLTDEHTAAIAALTTERIALRSSLETDEALTADNLPEPPVILSEAHSAQSKDLPESQPPLAHPDLSSSEGSPSGVTHLSISGEALLSTYDRLSKGKGTGLSEALDHKCSACQMKVRDQRWNDLTGREHDADLFTCETCGRILFYDTRHDTPGRVPVIDRLRSAQALSK